jgi:hypothetical protein
LAPTASIGTILKPGDPSHRLTAEISAQILGLLNNPMRIPRYLYEGRLVPLSKNKGKDQAELKDIRPIVVRSHVSKIMEKAILERIKIACLIFENLRSTKLSSRKLSILPFMQAGYRTKSMS